MTSSSAAERALASADEAIARCDVDAAVAHLSAAIRDFTSAGDKRRAAMACVALGDVMASAMGNLTASRAWFARASRLVADEEPCIEQGWIAIAAMGCDVDDPARLLAAAELALDRARRFGDVNLETKALADAGLAHVRAGRLGEGMAMLDEAMALACGPADDATAAARSVCSFFSACYHAADFARADTWAALLRNHGLISLQPGGPVFLSGHCDSVTAAMLIELGRWSDAEALLQRAAADFEAAMSFRAWHPTIVLADLRVRQGRLAEAEALLVGCDQFMEALLPAARLHLAAGDHDLARSAARRGLRAIADDRLRAVELLTVLVDTELAAGDIEAAAEACDELGLRASGLDVPSLRSRANSAQARVLAARGEVDAAIATIEKAIGMLDEARLPFLHATLLLELAALRDRSGDHHGAQLDAAAAKAIVSVLDVTLPVAQTAALRQLAPAVQEEPVTATLVRDDRWWTVCDGETTARLPDTKGLRYLARLVESPSIERHVLDLVDAVDGVDPDVVDRRALGDAGDLLDARTRTQYRHRIEQLRVEADDAVEAGLLESAERLEIEIDQLVGELARAFGLGGRSRQASSAAEKARLNVTRALRAAIARIADAIPGVGDELDRQIRTGLYCVYQPGDRFIWVVQSRLNESDAR